MTSAPLAVGVVVPARDECAVIGDCVRAIRRSMRAAAAEGWIVVVADDCSDGTAAEARTALGPAGEVIERRARAVGAARRAGCEQVLQHFGDRVPRDIVLASTDADSVVAPPWVATHLSAIRNGAAAVAGSVVVDSFAGRHPRLRARFEQLHRPQPDGRHAHVHGANLSVRADAYLAVGGFDVLPTGEEHDLWARLNAHGYQTLSTMLAPVTTSGRRRGRAPSGFAGYLNALERAVDKASA